MILLNTWFNADTGKPPSVSPTLAIVNETAVPEPFTSATVIVSLAAYPWPGLLIVALVALPDASVVIVCITQPPFDYHLNLNVFEF